LVGELDAQPASNANVSPSSMGFIEYPFRLTGWPKFPCECESRGAANLATQVKAGSFPTGARSLGYLRAWPLVGAEVAEIKIQLPPVRGRALALGPTSVRIVRALLSASKATAISRAITSPAREN
jgi:hypothetical protein